MCNIVVFTAEEASDTFLFKICKCLVLSEKEGEKNKNMKDMEKKKWLRKKEKGE
jgi:hypothetical protein